MIAPIYQDLSKKLEAYIAEKGLHGRLPGVLKLSKELGVHHVTLSKALRILERKGILSIHGTRGTFINEGKTGRPLHHVIALVGVNSEQIEGRERLGKLNDFARSFGYNVIGITFENELFRRNMGMLLNFPVDAFLFRMSSLRKEQAELLHRENIPIVSCARKKGYSWLDQTDCDHDAGYSVLLDRLIALGHRRIAFLEFDRIEEYRFYLDDIRSVFQRKLGNNFAPSLFYVKETGYDLWRRFGEEYWNIYPMRAIRHWFSRPDPPTAVIVPFHLFVRLRAILTKMNFRIPQDVSLLYVNHSTEIPDQDAAGVQFDEDEMLLWGMRRLIDRLNGKEMEPAQYLQKPFFHDGKTCGNAPSASWGIVSQSVRIADNAKGKMTNETT